jgi:hypothetical protein
MSFEESLSTLGCHGIFIWAVSPCFFARFCEYNRSSFLTLAFKDTRLAFNGNLNQWDVAKVTTMRGSKSICIVENDLT